MILIATLPEVLVLDEAITAHPSLRSLDIATAQCDRSQKEYYIRCLENGQQKQCIFLLQLHLVTVKFLFFLRRL